MVYGGFTPLLVREPRNDGAQNDSGHPLLYEITTRDRAATQASMALCWAGASRMPHGRL